MKYTVITMLYNNYDLLRTPLVVDENAEYICITDDKNLKSDVWKIIYEEKYDTDKLTGVQKTYMTKYSIYDYVSKDSEYIIQLDASMLITNSLNPIIELFKKNNYEMGLSVHGRPGLRQEYNAWTTQRKLDKKYVEMFLTFYNKHYKDKFDLNSSGLIECSIKIYKNCDKTKKFINDVYNALKEQSNFEDANDQCVFMCVLYDYMTNTNILFFNEKFYKDGKYMNRCNHKSLIKQAAINHKKENYNVKLFGKFDVEVNIFN